MNIEDIKVGETYNVRVTVEEKSDAAWIQARTSERAHSFVLAAREAEAFSPISPENGTKNTETAPKYDPNRMFRKGDKVRLCEYNGRAPFDNENFEPEEAGQLCIIAEDEDNENAYSLHVWKLEDMKRETDDGERPWFAFPLMFMELVTPVEELEISRVFNDKKMGAWIVTKDNFTHAYFPYRCEVSDNIANGKEEAKAAAEAERDRLNAEYRKEQNNG